MKCRVGNGAKCFRCERAGVPCIYKARANAASSREHLQASSTAFISPTQDGQSSQSIVSRLQRIEAYLGFATHPPMDEGHPMDDIGEAESDDDGLDPGLAGVWQAVSVLKRISPRCLDSKIWSRAMIRQLWLSSVIPCRAHQHACVLISFQLPRLNAWVAFHAEQADFLIATATSSLGNAFLFVGTGQYRVCFVILRLLQGSV